MKKEEIVDGYNISDRDQWALWKQMLARRRMGLPYKMGPYTAAKDDDVPVLEVATPDTVVIADGRAVLPAKASLGLLSAWRMISSIYTSDYSKLVPLQRLVVQVDVGPAADLLLWQSSGKRWYTFDVFYSAFSFAFRKAAIDADYSGFEHFRDVTVSSVTTDERLLNGESRHDLENITLPMFGKPEDGTPVLALINTLLLSAGVYEKLAAGEDLSAAVHFSDESAQQVAMLWHAVVQSGAIPEKYVGIGNLLVSNKNALTKAMQDIFAYLSRHTTP